MTTALKTPALSSLSTVSMQGLSLAYLSRRRLLEGGPALESTANRLAMHPETLGNVAPVDPLLM